MIMFFVHTCIFSSFCTTQLICVKFDMNILITHLYILFKFLTMSNSTLVAV